MSVLSAATGKDASHNAGVAQQQSQTYQTQAAPLYNNLASQGQSLTNTFNSQFSPLMSLFESAAGLPNTVGGTGSQATGQAGLTGASGGSTGASGNTASGGGKAPTTQANATQQMQALPGSLAQYAASNPTFNPYQLNPDGQAYLASQLDQMNQTTNNTISAYNSQLAASGIQDSTSAAAGTAYIKQQSQMQQNQFVSNFMLQQQQQQEQAAAQLLSTIMGVGAQGASETGQGASGLAGLAQTSAGTAQQEQALANSQMQGVGSFLGQFIPGGSFASALGNYGIGGTSGVSGGNQGNNFYLGQSYLGG